MRDDPFAYFDSVKMSSSRKKHLCYHGIQQHCDLGRLDDGVTIVLALSADILICNLDTRLTASPYIHLFLS